MEPPTPPAAAPLAELPAEPLLTPAYERDPAAAHARLRAAHGAVAPVELYGVKVWLVLGYPQTLEILRDARGVWSKRPDAWRAHAEGRLPADWPLLHVYAMETSLFRDGKDLNRLRAAWSAGLKPFQDRTRPSARALEQAALRHADDLITAITEHGGRTGTTDLAVQYARPLPLLVLHRLLGLPDDDNDELLLDMWRTLDAGPEAAESAARLRAAVAGACAARAAEPADDLPSAMLAAVPGLTADEVAREMLMLVGLLGDGTGALISATIAGALGAGDRDELSAAHLQETVNRAALNTPPMTNLTLRFARADTRVDGTLVAAGDPVLLSPAAAHTDPAFAGDRPPDAIYSSRAHLAWGAGAHACLGRELATTITVLAVERLLHRFTDLRLDVPGDELTWRVTPHLRSLAALPVRYELEAAPVRAQPAAEPAAARGPSPGRRFIRRLLRR
ncbi:cytochrome P450 [Actinomadura flavalba]|uniref:cytochrome P450 n=1 Tax=Actinomadura flavalba TaxID=1120938 RepID=UPI0003681AB4|nr:cytochrome P450 [Actinomadura flavalba]